MNPPRCPAAPLVGLLLLALGACASDPGAIDDPSLQARDAARPGPWGVGVTTLEEPDPEVAGRKLTIEVWYPALTAADDPRDQQLGLSTGSVRDAAADLRGAPFPVIGFSHGNGGVRYQSFYLTEHLASHGYVVVAPDHAHNTLFDNNTKLISEVVRNRPRDIRLAVDAALQRSGEPGGLLSGTADATRIGTSGHSFGGFTALVVGGAKIDLPALAAACVTQPDDLACWKLDGTITDEVLAKLPDPRVRAILALAPGGRIAFGATGLSAISQPILIHAGELDMVTPLVKEARSIFDSLSAPKQMAELNGAAHFSFTDICPLYEKLGGPTGMLGFLATEGCGANTVPVKDVQQASRTLALAFFDRALKGLPDTGGYLDPARGVPGARLR